MTASPVLDAWLRTLPDRCQECLWSPKKQGHQPTCSKYEAPRFIDGSRR